MAVCLTCVSGHRLACQAHDDSRASSLFASPDRRSTNTANNFVCISERPRAHSTHSERLRGPRDVLGRARAGLKVKPERARSAIADRSGRRVGNFKLETTTYKHESASRPRTPRLGPRDPAPPTTHRAPDPAHTAVSPLARGGIMSCGMQSLTRGSAAPHRASVRARPSDS